MAMIGSSIPTPEAVVGIAVDVGDDEIVAQLLERMPEDAGMSFVVVANPRASDADAITHRLLDQTLRPTHVVTAGTVLLPNTITWPPEAPTWSPSTPDWTSCRPSPMSRR
jgi:hypothetical protein